MVACGAVGGGYVSTWGRPRLAPWRGEDGKPCFLVAEEGGQLDRLADEMEAELLRIGAELLEIAEATLNDENAPSGEVRFLACRLREAVRDALLVAESRGGRIPAPEHVRPRLGWNERAPAEEAPR